MLSASQMPNGNALNFFSWKSYFTSYIFKKNMRKKRSSEKFTCDVIVQILVTKSGLYIITGKGYDTQKSKDFSRYQVKW